MSLCESCRNYENKYSFNPNCKNRTAKIKMLVRSVFHEDRTANYKPSFKQLYYPYSYFCAMDELKSCSFYRKKWFVVKEVGDFKHKDVKDIFEIKE